MVLIDKDSLKANIIKRLGISGEEYLLPAEKVMWGVINDEPPVQSDVPVTNVGDMISRQAAIDEAVAYIEEWNNAKSEYHKKEITRRFQNLPSAQAERTCVNCGRTVNNGGWYADGSTRCPIEEHYALPKDGYCHLWEKRNVTDDDYPERRTDER